MGRLRVAAGCWLLPAACPKVVTVSLREAEMWVGELAAIEELRSEWVGADNVQNSTDSAQETGCEKRAEGVRGRDKEMATSIATGVVRWKTVTYAVVHRSIKLLGR